MINQYKNVYNIGVNYKKVDAHIRGKFSLSQEKQIALLQEAKKTGIDGIFVLSTCNRTEVTGFAEHPFQLIRLLCKFSEGTVEEFSKVSTVHKNQEAIHHLFRIGTGLDSQILGDYEIAGQLRKAFKQAKEQNTTNAYLERLLNSVIQASKQVKNKTKLSSGTTSVSYAAVQYLLANVPTLDSKHILIFGLGKMGMHTCKNISEYTHCDSVTLINRTDEKALEFAKQFKTIESAKYADLKKELNKADILIVATNSHEPTVTSANVAPDKELLILDLSVPSNVCDSLKDHQHIRVIDVDELSKITDETFAARKQEIPLAENIIEKHRGEFNEWLNYRRFTPAINAIKDSLEGIQKEEIAYHKKKIADFDEDHATLITSKIIQKITSQFVMHLKDDETSVPESIHMITKIFGTTTK